MRRHEKRVLRHLVIAAAAITWPAFQTAHSHAVEKAPKGIREYTHGSHVYQIAISPDGKLIATDDQLWDAATGKKIRTLSLTDPKDRFPFRIAFSPDSKRIAIHRYNDLVLEEATTGKYIWTIPLPPRKPYHVDTPRLAFTPDGKHILTARNDEGVIRVVSVEKGREVRSFEYDPVVGGLMGCPIGNLTISADGKRVFAHVHESILSGGLVLFDLESGKELARRRVGEEKAWVNFAASLDCRHAFYAKRNAVHMIDLETGKEIRRFEGVGVFAFYVACSPNAKYVAATVRETATSKDDWVQVWNVATGETVNVFKEHKGGVGCPVFSPSSESILSVGADNTARLWHLRD